MKNKPLSAINMSKPVRMPLAFCAMVGFLALVFLGPEMTMLGDAESGAGNVFRQFGYGVLFLSALAAVRPLKHPERLNVIPWPFLVALGWCWLTLLWAIDPSISVRRLLLTTLIIWSVFGLVRMLGRENSIRVVRIACVIMLAVNFFTVFAFPTVGLHNVDGDDPLLLGKWRGLMGHKNVAGEMSALTIIVFSFDRRGIPYAAVGAVILLSAAFLWFSDSKTSLGIVLFATISGFAVSKLKARRDANKPVSPVVRYLSIKLFIIVLTMFPVIHYGVQSDLFLNYLSDPSGLTGRTEIWAGMMRYYLNNPVFSAGYGSFWGVGNASPIYSTAQGWVQGVSEGHNGYLDLLVTIGLPGLVAVLFCAFVFPAQKLWFSRELQAPTCALLASLIIFCFGHNFTESSLFDRDSLGQVFLLLAIALLWAGGGSGQTVKTEPAIQKNLDKPAMNKRARISKSRRK